MQRSIIFTFLLLTILGQEACKKSAPPSPPTLPKSAATTLEIEKDKPLLFTFIEEKGTFSSTEKAEDIPEKVRAVVRVVDPSARDQSGMDTTRVWVVDVRELLSAGKAKAQSLSREAFETSALAQLGPGESSPMSGEHGPALVDIPGIVDGGGQGQVPVTLYGTPWCGACRSAKEYLSANKIPFAYKDIENDPSAAKELAAKAARLGIATDRVPILDVRGRLMVGFDKARLQSLLGPTI